MTQQSERMSEIWYDSLVPAAVKVARINLEVSASSRQAHTLNKRDRNDTYKNILLKRRILSLDLFSNQLLGSKSFRDGGDFFWFSQLANFQTALDFSRFSRTEVYV